MVYNSTDFQNATLVKIAKTLMHSGIVRIVFEKRNGEIRTAIATTSEGIVGTQTKSGRYLCDESVTPFFDTSKLRPGRRRDAPTGQNRYAEMCGGFFLSPCR